MVEALDREWRAVDEDGRALEGVEGCGLLGVFGSSELDRVGARLGAGSTLGGTGIVDVGER